VFLKTITCLTNVNKMKTMDHTSFSPVLKLLPLNSVCACGVSVEYMCCVHPKLYPIKIIAAEFVHSIYMHHVETAKGHWLAANVGYNCP